MFGEERTRLISLLPRAGTVRFRVRGKSGSGKTPPAWENQSGTGEENAKADEQVQLNLNWREKWGGMEGGRERERDFHPVIHLPCTHGVQG